MSSLYTAAMINSFTAFTNGKCVLFGCVWSELRSFVTLSCHFDCKILHPTCDLVSHETETELMKF